MGLEEAINNLTAAINKLTAIQRPAMFIEPGGLTDTMEHGNFMNNGPAAPGPDVPPVAVGSHDLTKLDKENLPWDDRINTSNKAQTAKGVWKRKPGLEESVVEQVKTELRALVAGAPAALVAAPSLTAAAPSLPAAPPLPASLSLPAAGGANSGTFIAPDMMGPPPPTGGVMDLMGPPPPTGGVMDLTTFLQKVTAAGYTSLAALQLKLAPYGILLPAELTDKPELTYKIAQEMGLPL